MYDRAARKNQTPSTPSNLKMSSVDLLSSKIPPPSLTPFGPPPSSSPSYKNTKAITYRNELRAGG